MTNETSPHEVEVTTKRLLKVWWAFLWRSVLVTIGAMAVSMVVGAVVGAALGFVMHLGGYGTEEIQIVARPVGMVLGGLIGVGFSIIPVKLLLGKSFGEFRLVLVSNTEEQIEQPSVAV